MTVDIVIGTRNRVAHLQRTIECIQERTKTPHRLLVIDDASGDGTQEYVRSLQGVRYHRNDRQRGMHGNLSQIAALTKSDPVICTDDDALCPLLQPDWLYRLITEMRKRPRLWMLGLNNPSDNVTGSRHPFAEDGPVVYSQWVSGHFLAQRRKLLEVTPTLFDSRKSKVSPNKTQAEWVRRQGAVVGYLKDVYTFHFCPTSVRRPGKDWGRIMIEPIDDVTLEPPERYRQWPLQSRL